MSYFAGTSARMAPERVAAPEVGLAVARESAFRRLTTVTSPGSRAATAALGEKSNLLGASAPGPILLHCPIGSITGSTMGNSHHPRNISANPRRQSMTRFALEPVEPRLFLSAARHAMSAQQRALVMATAKVCLEPQADSSTTAGYTPEQIRNAYGFDEIHFANNTVTGDGSGQTIAIVDAYHDPNIQSDLHTFSQNFNLGDAPSFTQVSQTGGSTDLIATNAGWAGESALDVEWAHAIAPQANILLVEANSSSLNDLLSAVDYARHADGVSVVSMSWGTTEFFGQSAYDQTFTTPAGHQGVTFVAASGDFGSRFGPSWAGTAAHRVSGGGTR